MDDTGQQKSQETGHSKIIKMLLRKWDINITKEHYKAIKYRT